MSPKDQAQHLSEALQKATARLHQLEHELYTSKGNREEVKRLKRVVRALDRDLAKLTRTIPAPIQYSLWEEKEVDAPRVAASQFEGQKLSEEDRGDLPLRGVQP